MKKIYSIIFINLCYVAAFSQSLNISPNDPNYAAEKLKLIKSTSQNQKVSGQTTQNQIANNFSCNCLIPRDNTYITVLPYTDDATTPLIQMPFNFCYFGTNYTQFRISTNGNIQFLTNSVAFSSTGFPNTTDNMIAPFWADVDTRGTGNLSYKLTPTALIVKWDSVGFYNSHTDKINTFQLIITDGMDSLVPNGNNVSFCYGDMQWTTGDASSGINGFPNPSVTPSIPATAGINQGNGVDYYQIGRFGAPGTGYNGPYNADDSVDVLDNMHFVFNTCSVGNAAPFAASNVCDTTNVSPNQIVTGTVFVYAPEINQSVTVNSTEQNFKTSSNAFSITNITYSQGGAIVNYQFDASQVAPGSRIVANIYGKDNSPALVPYSLNLYFKVANVTGITEKEIFETPFAYPNPATGILYISNFNEPLTVKLFDLLGNEVIEKNISGIENRTISTEKLSSGYYFAKIYSNGRLITNQKLILNK